jgi:hypothetical protein
MQGAIGGHQVTDDIAVIDGSGQHYLCPGEKAEKDKGKEDQVFHGVHCFSLR